MLILLGSTYSRALHQGKNRRKGRQTSCELACEPLEPRLLLATFVWTGGGSDTDWTTTANWSIQSGVDDGVADIPDAADIAVFDNISSGGLVTWSGSQDVAEIQLNNTTGNDFTLANSSTQQLDVETITQSGDATNTISATIDNAGGFVGTINAGSLVLGSFQNTIASGTWTVGTDANLLVVSSGSRSGLGSANVDIQGGNLEFTLPPDPFTDTPGQLEGSYWDANPDDEPSGGINNGGIEPFDTFAGLNDYIARLGTPDASALLTTPIDFPAGGGNNSTNGNPFSNIGVNVGNDNQVAVWRGFLQVDAADAGNTTFFTASDDGSVLYINGIQVVNNNRFQGVTERSGTFNLTAGTHEIVIAFYERGGGAGVTASWQGAITGGNKVLIDPTFTGNSSNSFFFTREVLGSIDPAIALTNNVQVSDSGEITIGASVDSVSLGTLTVLADQELTVQSVDGSRGLVFANTNVGTNQSGSASFRTENFAQLTLNNILETNLTNLFVRGDGTVFLPTDNTFTGTTTVEAGATLDITADQSLGQSGAGTVVQADGSLRISNGITVAAETLSLEGGGNDLSDGALQNASDNNTWSGAITLSNDATIRSSNGTLTLTGGIDTSGFEVEFEVFGTVNVQTAGIIGTGSVRKNQPGTLNFRVDNSYTGITQVQDGILDINVDAGLGTTDGITQVSNGATLRLRGGFSSAENIEVTGNGEGNQGAIRNDAGTNTLTGSLTLTGDTGVDVDGGSELIVAGEIRQTGSSRQLEKFDGGTLRLQAENTYTGQTLISGGTVIVESNQAFGTDAAGTVVSVGTTLEFDLPGDYTTQEVLSVAGTLRNRGSDTTLASPSIDVAGPATIESVTADTTFTLVGDIDLQNFNLTVLGDGDTVLEGDVTSVDFTNGFAAGLLVGRIASPNDETTPNPGNEGIQFGVDYGQTNQAPPWAGNTTFVYTGQFFDADGVFAFAENIDDRVRISIEGQEILRSDQWNIATSTATDVGDDGTSNRNPSFIGNAGEVVTDFSSLDADGDGWYDIEIRISNGGGGAGPGENQNGWKSGANGFGFGLNSNPDFSSTPLNEIAFGSNYVAPVDDGSATLFRFANSGRAGVVKQGSGSLTLSGDNSYEGETDIREGTVFVTSNTALGSNEADTTVESGASLVLQGNITLPENLNLAGSGDPEQLAALVSDTGSNTIAGDMTFTGSSSLGANAGATLIVGGNVDLQTFSGLVDGEGDTIINGVISGTGEVTVLTDATLGGSGTISGAVVQEADSTLSPGSQTAGTSEPGVLNIGDGLTLDADSNFTVQLEGTTRETEYDGVDVTGEVNLSGANLDLQLDSFVPEGGDTFILIDNDGADAIIGTFAGLLEGTVFDVDGVVFTISYLGGSGNDVTLVSGGAAETEVSLDGSGNLVVTDINGGNTNDSLQISVQSGNYVITDPNVALTTTILGATRPDANTIVVPVTDVSGGLILDLQAGDDATAIEGTVALSGDL